MHAKAQRFIEGVLGADGLRVLKKAADRSPLLDSALLPRTIMAWLAFAANDYEGQLPGVENTYCSIHKSESGTYSGVIGLGDENYAFEDVPLQHVAAGVAVSLGADGDHVDPALRDAKLVNLGKSIDILAKARVVVAGLLARKAEPGKAAAPTAQGAPVGPTAPIKQPAHGTAAGTKVGTPAGKTPAIPKAGANPPAAGGLPKVAGGTPKPAAGGKMPSIKVPLKAAEKKCGTCGEKLFKSEDEFGGCVCWMDLAKSVVTVRDGDSLVLNFGRGWDAEALAVLLQTLRQS